MGDDKKELGVGEETTINESAHNDDAQQMPESSGEAENLNCSTSDTTNTSTGINYPVSTKKRSAEEIGIVSKIPAPCTKKSRLVAPSTRVNRGERTSMLRPPSGLKQPASSEVSTKAAKMKPAFDLKASLVSLQKPDIKSFDLIPLDIIINVGKTAWLQASHWPR